MICPVTVRLVAGFETSRMPREEKSGPNVMPRSVVAVGPVYLSVPGKEFPSRTVPRTRLAGAFDEAPTGPATPPLGREATLRVRLSTTKVGPV